MNLGGTTHKALKYDFKTIWDKKTNSKMLVSKLLKQVQDNIFLTIVVFTYLQKQSINKNVTKEQSIKVLADSK